MVELTVLSPAGERKVLGDLIGGKPAVLVFLRHFG